jgi:hypothetical protein
MTRSTTRPTGVHPTPQPTAAFQDKILTLLAPLFLVATGGDVDAARETVRATLIGYRARTDDELRLAALVVAFGFGALDALSRASNPDLTLDAVMDLRDNAIALSQAGERSQTVLDGLLKRRAHGAASMAEPAALPASIEVDDLLAFARNQAPVGHAGVKAKQQRVFRTLRVTPSGSRTTLH